MSDENLKDGVYKKGRWSDYANCYVDNEFKCYILEEEDISDAKIITKINADYAAKKYVENFYKDEPDEDNVVTVIFLDAQNKEILRKVVMLFGGSG